MDFSSWWALFLNLDGALIQTDALHQTIWSEILGSYGIRLTSEEYNQRIAGRSDDEIWKDWNVGTNVEHKMWNNWKTNVILENITEMIPTPGGRELIQNWMRDGQWIGVISNWNSKISNALISHLQIDNIDVLITSDTWPNPTTSIERYQTALSELGIPHNRCIIVEHSDLGIISAKQLNPERLFRIVPSLFSSSSSFLRALSKHGEIPISDLYDDLLLPPRL